MSKYVEQLITNVCEQKKSFGVSQNTLRGSWLDFNIGNVYVQVFFSRKNDRDVGQDSKLM